MCVCVWEGGGGGGGGGLGCIRREEGRGGLGPKSLRNNNGLTRLFRW